MESEPSDDMMFLCSEDGSLALTGLELRRRNNQPGQRPVSPVGSAGRVLHAWDITDRAGNAEYREYTTTQGYLVSDGEVIAEREAFAEVDPKPGILPPDRIEARINEATEETNFSGLKSAYSEDELRGLQRNAETLSRLVSDRLSVDLSLFSPDCGRAVSPTSSDGITSIACH